MNGRLSSSTKALLEAARADAPSASAKAKMWSGVAAASGLAGAGSVAEAGSRAAASQAATGGGALVGATLFGGLLVVGLAAVLLRVVAVPQSRAPALSQLAHAEVVRGAMAPPAAPSAKTPSSPAPMPIPPFNPAEPGPQAKPSPVPGSYARSAASASPRAADGTSPASPEPGRNLDDALDREASLVAEARGALLRGDPRAALEKIHAARAIPSGELAPEELSIEAQSLRALGRIDAADDADAKLRRAFPESALAR
jgi:hypothetical protein